MTLDVPNEIPSQQIGGLAAARIRYMDDALASAIALGAKQHVILGAPAASPNSPLRVFHTGHPDIDQQSLCSALEESGFQFEQISFFSWLGASRYLTAQDTIARLAFIGSLPTGSSVVFDYAVERTPVDPSDQMAMDALASRCGKPGELLRLFINPTALDRLLRAAGFHHIEDLGPREIETRYRSQLNGITHFVNARV